MRRTTVSRTVAFSAVVPLAVLMLVPFFWLVRSSFMTQLELYLYPPPLWTKGFSLSNYVKAFTSINMPRLFGNTVTILIPVLAGTLITATMSAYAFARLRFPLRTFWFACVVSSMMLPAAVTLIPTFLIWSRLHGVNTFLPLTVPVWFGGGAFNVFLLRQFFMGIPRDLEDAAFIDGAGYGRILLRVMLPLLKPALVVVALFTFIGVWNDFLSPLIYLNDERLYTLALGLTQFIGTYTSRYNLLMAFAVMMVLPPITVFLFGQKYFIQGVVMSGLKL